MIKNRDVKIGVIVVFLSLLWMLVLLNHKAFSFDPSVKAAKARIMKRLKVIVELKAKGIVGEDNRGYLELLKGEGEKYKEIVQAENRDRKLIYQYIARTQKVPLEAVERLRAKQIRERALSGQWLQDPSGQWYKKP